MESAAAIPAQPADAMGEDAPAPDAAAADGEGPRWFLVAAFLACILLLVFVGAAVADASLPIEACGGG